MVDLPAGLRAAPSANSDVEEGGRFQFRTANNFFTSSRLPTLDESKVNAGSRDLNLTDADIAAFVQAVISGIDLTAAGGSGTVTPCDKRNEDVASLEFAREAFQSSRG